MRKRSLYIISLRALRLLCALCGFALYTAQLYAQDPTIGDLVDIGDGMTDTEVLTRLEAWRHTPLDLNRATRQELEQLPWLNTRQVEGILQWRKSHGRFNDIEALRMVHSIDAEIIDHLRPFVQVNALKPEISGRWRLTESRRLRNGSTATGQGGIQSDMTVGDQIRWGVRLERKTADRHLQWRSGYAEFLKVAWIEQAVLGHYNLEYGQGLIYGTAHNRRIEGLYSQVKWRPRGLVAARSSRQRDQLIGAALVTRLSHIRLTTLLARIRTGGHIYGLRAAWARPFIKLGMTITEQRVKDTETTQGFYRLHQSNMDLEVSFGPTNMFAELAWVQNSYTGISTGIQWHAGPVDGGAMVIQAKAPGIRVTSPVIAPPQTYRIAMRLRYKPDRLTFLILAYDTRPRRTQLFSPMTTRLTARARRRFSRSWVISGLFQANDEHVSKQYNPDTNFKWQTQADWHLIKGLRVRGRFEWQQTNSFSRHQTEKGYRSLVDVRYQPERRMTISGQWSGIYGGTATTSQIIEGESFLEEDSRSRWGIWIQSPLTTDSTFSIRYAKNAITNITDTTQRQNDITWAIQLTGRW